MFRQLISACLVFVAVASSPYACWSDILVAEDFFYRQPTKAPGVGGGFALQDFGGGQNSQLGQWGGEWVSVGDGTVFGLDHENEDEHFQAFTRNFFLDDAGDGLNYLERVYELGEIPDDQPLFFSTRLKVQQNGDAATLEEPVRFILSSPNDDAIEISIGFDGQSFSAILGLQNSSVMMALDQPDGEFHTVVGQLELNVNGPNDQLTVFFDPIDDQNFLSATVVTGDVAESYADLSGNLRLDQGGPPNAMNTTHWDDISIATTFADTLTVDVPRLTFQVDTEKGDVAFVNETATDFELSYYEIQSSSEFLDFDGWVSLQQQQVEGWRENSPQEGQLTESSFGMPLDLASGERLDLGSAYSVGAPEDLIARFGTPNGLLNVAHVVYGVFSTDPTCDFDADGLCNLRDVDLLLGALGSDDPTFDLDGSGTVDDSDISIWLADAGNENGFGEAYRRGDTNLDGQVSAQDLNNLGVNWNRADATSWEEGDFNGDKSVDATELNQIGLNWQSDISVALAVPVPEPCLWILVLSGLLASLTVRRRR